jgi:peptidoglycan-N-acetylglucosamine deacetylase
MLACLVAPASLAADCPGHPNALGTSRTLVVDPKEHPRIGTMQYPETLPLADHEVVLTFDDGPLPRYSNQVLEILASQCVKATFFTIGRMAKASPEGVRKLREAGHTIATHSEDHPLTMNRMGIERAKQEIEAGIASVKAALGEDADTSLAPFFRFPGLLRSGVVEDYLAEQGIQTWSTDFLADDWRHISASRVYELAMNRLETEGKGILLLHDIHPRTIAALPRILDEMKARGFHIVQVVPASAERPPTPTEPEQWQPHAPSQDVIARWPKVPNFVFAELGELPAPSLSDLGLIDEKPLALTVTGDHSPAFQGLPSRRETLWRPPGDFRTDDVATTLPVPAQSVFEIPDGLRSALHGVVLLSHHAELAAPRTREAGKRAHLRNTSSARHHAGHVSTGPRHGSRRVAGRASPPPATGHRGPQAKRRSV